MNPDILASRISISETVRIHLILDMVNEAIKVAKKKDPNFLDSWLISRYKILLKELAAMTIANIQPTRAFQIEFTTVVSRHICGFAHRSNTLTWKEFERVHQLQEPKTNGEDKGIAHVGNPK